MKGKVLSKPNIIKLNKLRTNPEFEIYQACVLMRIVSYIIETLMLNCEGIYFLKLVLWKNGVDHSIRK